MYDTPCSRIGHVFRGGSPFPNDRKGIDFVTINYKRHLHTYFFYKYKSLNCKLYNYRVAEVWMDEYKEFVYKRDPEKYAKANVGGLQRKFCRKTFFDNHNWCRGYFLSTLCQGTSTMQTFQLFHKSSSTR